MWSIILTFLKKKIWTDFLSAVPFKVYLIVGVVLTLLVLSVKLRTTLETLSFNNSELVKKIELLSTQNKQIRDINRENLTLYKKLKSDIKEKHEITTELIKSVSEIKNVEHTKEIIIKEATGSCLDSPYPLSIYNTFLWDDEK